MKTERVWDDPTFPFGGWMMGAFNYMRGYELGKKNRNVPFWIAQLRYLWDI